MERWSDYRHAILANYWRHLVDDHQFDEGYDIDIEYAIMQDYLLHGCEVPDDGIITIKCDHCQCNHTQKYRVLYHVTRINMEEEE
jgi:hypothetical protein